MAKANNKKSSKRSVGAAKAKVRVRAKKLSRRVEKDVDPVRKNVRRVAASAKRSTRRLATRSPVENVETITNKAKRALRSLARSVERRVEDVTR
jgi:hypothetical protein